MFRLIFCLFVFYSFASAAFDHLGAEACQSCHQEAYAAWKLSAHARSKDTLSPAQQKDIRCLSCHSPNEADHRVQQVSCESCHGGGQYYTPRFVMKDAELVRLAGLLDVSEKSCKTCHDASSPSLKPFEFGSKLKQIDHWTKERDKRKAKGNTPPPRPKKPT
jgi:Cytochrome c7 and related cytochrome c